MAEVMGLYIGIVASIGTLLQLSKQVAGYITDTAGANQQKTDLLKEVNATTALLDDLESKMKSPGQHKPTQSIGRLDEPLELLGTALKTLESKLRPSHNPFIKVTKRWVWHFQKDELTEILSQVERSKSSLSIALHL
jgi:hypothetical protein